MNRKIAPKKKSHIRRESAPVSWKYILLATFCGVFLAAGLFGAARQHFASIDFGIKNAKLRKQIDDIRSEQRRLQLAKEVALSPGEIKKNAQNIGLTVNTTQNTHAYSADSLPPETPKAKQITGPESDIANGKLALERNRSNKTGDGSPAKNTPSDIAGAISRKRTEPATKKIEQPERTTSIIKAAPKDEVADLSTTRKRKL